MKIGWLIMLMLALPLFSVAETSISVKKIKDGKVCDTCVVASISNLGKPISYMIVGAQEENEYLTSHTNQTINSSLPHLSNYRIAAGSFSLDFIPVDLLDINMYSKKEFIESEKLKKKDLQFLVQKNGRLVQNWTNIYTLDEDTNFQLGLSSTQGTVEQYFAWENYHAGTFQLNVNDSLVVLVRSAVTNRVVESILIKRLLLFPTYFDLIKFPSNTSIEDVMYGKFSMSTSGNNIHADSIDNYEMEPDEIIALRFSDDPRVRTNELEYSFSNEPGKWKTISTSSAQNTLPGFFSIVIYKPTPGETQEVLLRYIQQPESIHHIKIHVKKRLVSSNWFKILTTLGAAALLFAGWYAFKRRSHLKQLRRVVVEKEEIESKLQLLSGQLNPHFLFNSLNSIQSLINKNDLENANQYVAKVSSFLRTIMDAGKKEYVSLQEELEMEEAYIQL